MLITSRSSLISFDGAGVGHVHFDAGLQYRRGHHENDEQHQHHIDQRRDVDVGEGGLGASVGGSEGHQRRASVTGNFMLALDRLSFNQVEHLQREVVIARRHFANGANDEVVGDHRRNGCSQAGSGGNQSFGNSRGDRAQSCRASRAESVEGIDDSPDGAEQSDKRRNGAGNRKPRNIAFEASDLLEDATCMAR